jgi:hypothetical protein
LECSLRTTQHVTMLLRFVESRTRRLTEQDEKPQVIEIPIPKSDKYPQKTLWYVFKNASTGKQDLYILTVEFLFSLMADTQYHILKGVCVLYGVLLYPNGWYTRYHTFKVYASESKMFIFFLPEVCNIWYSFFT